MDLIEAGIIRIKTVSIIFIRCNLTCVYLDLPLSDRRVVVDEFYLRRSLAWEVPSGLTPNIVVMRARVKRDPEAWSDTLVPGRL